MRVRILNAILWSLSVAMFASMVYAPVVWQWVKGIDWTILDRVLHPWYN